jgi:hypothetical protein
MQRTATVRTRSAKAALRAFLAALIAVALLPAAALGQPATQAFAATGNWIDVADTSWYDPAEDSFSISTPQQLAGLAKLVNNATSDFSGKTVTLANDISLANPNGSGDAFLWTPIGDDDENWSFFYGTFDGNGHEISNLNVNVPYGAAGLFSAIYDGTASISNLRVSGTVSGTVWSGGIAGTLEGYGGQITVTNCGSNVTVNSTGTSTSTGVGGIAGSIQNATITNCYNTGNISGTGGARVGGIYGGISGVSTISDCYNTGTVTITSAANGGVAGGIAGAIRSNGSSLTNCYNAGAVAGSGTAPFYVGAISGNLANPSANGNPDVTVSNLHYLAGTANGADVGFDYVYAPATFYVPVAHDDASLKALAPTLGSAFVANPDPDGYPLLAWQSDGGDDGGGGTVIAGQSIEVTVGVKAFDQATGWDTGEGMILASEEGWYQSYILALYDLGDFTLDTGSFEWISSNLPTPPAFYIAPSETYVNAVLGASVINSAGETGTRLMPCFNSTDATESAVFSEEYGVYYFDDAEPLFKFRLNVNQDTVLTGTSVEVREIYGSLYYSYVVLGGTDEPLTGAPGSGDFNGDTFTTLDEALLLVQIINTDSFDTLSAGQFAAMDIDANGVLTMADVLMIVQIILNA